MNNSGALKVIVYDSYEYKPLVNAKVTITQEDKSYKYIGKNEIYTDVSGEVFFKDIPTPSLAISQSPGENTGLPPYSSWELKVEAPNKGTVVIKGVQVFPSIKSIQKVILFDEVAPAISMYRSLKEVTKSKKVTEVIIIPDHNLFSNFNEIVLNNKNLIKEETLSLYRVLKEVVIPDSIIVHIGSPDSNGPNYNVNFKEYIKNVASCEIYPTWSESTIRSNVHCIVSFTLNRIFTEWYRGKGKNFDVTNSTAYDHYFVYGRTIFENISIIVDDIFTQYIKRRGFIQPLLAQYCDGVRVKCPGRLTQWGSKYLGDQGKTPFEILSHFYGDNIELEYSAMVRGVPKSYPGYILTVGQKSDKVGIIQKYLNRISQNYPLIKKLAVDGIFGNKTEESVKVFQKIFNLPSNGLINSETWYKISEVYVGITKMAELYGEGEREDTPYAGEVLSYGSKGNEVKLVQDYLNVIRTKYPSIVYLISDGVYGYNTTSAVSAFQKLAGITITGKVDEVTWKALNKYYEEVKAK